MELLIRDGDQLLVGFYEDEAVLLQDDPISLALARETAQKAEGFLGEWLEKKSTGAA